MILLALVDLSCITCFVADVASDWLSCFPISVQKHLYDKFFLDGSVIEVVQVLVPFLHHVGDGGVDPNSVQTNVERCPKTYFVFLCFFPLSFCLITSNYKSLLLYKFFAFMCGRVLSIKNNNFCLTPLENLKM